MAKMRVLPNGVTEFEGTPEEVALIYSEINRLKTVPVTSYIPKPESAVTHLPSRKWGDAELEMKMPTVQALVDYILSRDKYEHDVIGTSMKFLASRSSLENIIDSIVSWLLNYYQKLESRLKQRSMVHLSTELVAHETCVSIASNK